MLRRRLPAAFLLAALAVSGCASSKVSEQEINRSETVPVRLRVEVRGDLNIAFEDEVASHFVVRRFTGENKDARQTQVVGTEPAEPIKFENGAFLAGVAVLPYDGDGEYTIPVGSPTDDILKAQQANTQPTAGSSVKVDWWPSGQVTGEPETYMRRAKPCKVVVERRGTKGTVRCPDVTNEVQTKHFSLTLSWQAPEEPGTSSTTSS